MRCDTLPRCRRALRLAPKLPHESLQFILSQRSLATGSNLEAHAPSGHQHAGFQRGHLAEVGKSLQNREVRVAIGSDADDAQRVAVTEVGPYAVSHDEQPAANPLCWIDSRPRSPDLIQ